jgi:hypothetical protein
MRIEFASYICMRKLNSPLNWSNLIDFLTFQKSPENNCIFYFSVQSKIKLIEQTIGINIISKFKILKFYLR